MSFSSLKYTLFIFISILLLNGCASPKKYYKQGNYDRAFYASAKKLRKKPGKVKWVDILVKSYNISNQQDGEQIDFLNKEGNPDRWESIFTYYNRLKNRQNTIRTLTRLKQSSGQIFVPTFINYDDEIINAKKNAAEYSYSKGVELLKRNSRESAREAHGHFLNAKRFVADYKDIDSKIAEAHSMGTSYVIFKIENQTGLIIPKQFEEEMLKISMHHLNRMWIQYHTQAISDLNYDYSINLVLRSIDVSPEGLKEVHYAETKEVQDGVQYVLDDRGNVKKDSLGNDIKIPKIVTISCNVMEQQQRKAARITGVVDFYNNQSKQLIRTEQVFAESIFENFFAVANGNFNALKPETRKKLDSRFVPFPTNPDMIMQCNVALKKMTQDFINANSGLFR
jgi:hypothetical protein